MKKRKGDLMSRKDVERLLLDISSNQRDHDQAQQSMTALKEYITTDPDMMRSFFDKIASYLYRKNVSVRIRATSLLLELSNHLTDLQFEGILPIILRQLESDSIIVIGNIATYIPNVIIKRPRIEEQILKKINEVDKKKFKTRNWNIVKASLIEAMDQFMDYSIHEEMIIKFIKQARLSTSPKTRKIANKVLKSRNLIE